MEKNSILRFLLIMAMMMLAMQIFLRLTGLGPAAPEDPNQPDPEPVTEALAQPIVIGDHEEQIIALGSYDPAQKQKYIAYFSNQGASLERLELVERSDNGAMKFSVIEFKHGYLGFLGATDHGNPPGARVRVVADGTPAALAKTKDGQTGLQFADIITGINGTTISNSSELHSILEQTHPGDQVELQIVRNDDTESVLTFFTTLGERPLEIIDPDPDKMPRRAAPHSLLTSIIQINETAAQAHQAELESVASLRSSVWNYSVADQGPAQITFTIAVPLPSSTENPTGSDGDLEITKTFRFADPTGPMPYHLDMELEFSNLSANRHSIVFRQDGPNNIVNETWWTSTSKKRDVKWKINDEEDDARGSDIFAKAKDEPEDPFESMLSPSEKGEQFYQYIVSDAQFFAVGFSTATAADQAPMKSMVLKEARTFPAESSPIVLDNNTEAAKLPNTSFFLHSRHLTLEPRQSHQQTFQVFAGPKQVELLSKYGMEGLIEYGWFRTIATLLGGILNFFFGVFGNYGIAIILLTVLIRLCLHPLSRKQVRGAQMMGFLKPQMQRLTEKYKDNPQQKTLKTQELFAKYGYNPLSGCLPVFLQMPIFFGLYRSIMVNSELRGESLIPGLQWCANLAGPDMLIYWGETSAIFINRGGFLGPYLNLLPIVTITLFILQQKIYAPPATDDTQKMAQRMMKFMMLFMGVMFFRVASGLCIYFIASSTWGLLERKLLPKVNDPEAYLEALAEKQKAKKKKPGFMQRMAQLADEQQRQKASGSDNQRRKQLDSLKGNRRRRR